MSTDQHSGGAPGDRLTMRDLKAFEVLVDRVLKDKAPDAPDRARWEGLRARLTAEVVARPGSLAPAISKALFDAVTQSPEQAERAIVQLGEAMYRAGDIEANPLLKRTAQSIRNARAQGGGISLGGGGAGGQAGAGDVRMSDDRAIEWYEPATLTDPVVLDARMEPVFQRLVRELKAAPTFLDLGIDAPTRVLFYGPPGVGKTLVGRWIGSELQVPVALVQIAGVLIPYVGATEKNLRRVFDEVARRPGAVIFLDEIDGLSARRDDERGSGTSGVGQSVTTVLLQILDGLPKDQIVIGATNFHAKVDPALDRRLATKIEFFYPDAAARKAMLAAWWRKLTVDDAAVAKLVSETDKRSGDFLRTVAMNAARLAITDDTVTPRRVTSGHVAQALFEAVPPGELRQPDIGGAGAGGGRHGPN